MLEKFLPNVFWPEIWQATLDTLNMLGGSLLFTVLLGLPLGVLLFLAGPRQLLEQPTAYRLMSFVVNLLRSVPFVILLILMIPFTELIVGMLDFTSAVGMNSTAPPMATEMKTSTANCAGRPSTARCHDDSVTVSRTSGGADAASLATSRPLFAVA